LLVQAASKNVNWDDHDGTTNAVESQNRVTGLIQNDNLALETRLLFNQDRKALDKAMGT
jgi:hypothetical protein